MIPARIPALRHRPLVAPARLLTGLMLLALVIGTAGAVHASPAPTGAVVFSKPDGLYVLSPGSGAAQRVWTAPAAGQAQEPRWSPNGARIAVVGPDGNIWVMNADGSSVQVLTSQAVRPSGCGEDS